MKAVLINPESQTIGTLALDPNDLLPGVRKALGLVSVTEGVIPQVVGPGVILWLHDRGLLMPEPKLWKLEESIFAGPAVLHRMHPFSAQFQDAPESNDVAERVTWETGVKLAAINEQLRIVQSPQGFVPVVDRSPQFEPLPAPEPQEAAPQRAMSSDPVQLWTVYRNGEGGFRGIKYEISAAGHSVIDDPVEADDLEVLYALMEVDEDLGDTRHPRDARDAPSIVETWRLAKR